MSTLNVATLASSRVALVDSRLRIAFAISAFLIAALVPIKEACFALAVLLLLIARPLNVNQMRLVLIQAWPILLMLAIGLLMTSLDVTGELDSRAVIRTAFYYVRIPVFLLLGFAARRYLRDDRPLLWAIVLLGVWGAGQTLFRYASGGNLSGLDHNEVRAVVGSGDTVSMLIPLCMVVLWPQTRGSAARAVLVGASGLALLAVLAASSRTGLLVLLISAGLSFPRVRPLQVARWGSVAILVGTFILTTPTLLPILDFLGINPLRINALAEVIARPRTDLQSINTQWRGYETYMGFLAASRDGFLPLFFGHGMSVYAPLGVLIELAPGQMFDRVDVFHNGWTFIVVHSGLLGATLYTAQFFLLARPPLGLGEMPPIRQENRLFAVTILSLAASTAVVAGAFNAGSFASTQMFLIGCFYPFSLVQQQRLPRRAVVVGGSA